MTKVRFHIPLEEIPPSAENGWTAVTRSTFAEMWRSVEGSQDLTHEGRRIGSFRVLDVGAHVVRFEAEVTSPADVDEIEYAFDVTQYVHPALHISQVTSRVKPVIDSVDGQTRHAQVWSSDE